MLPIAYRLANDNPTSVIQAITAKLSNETTLVMIARWLEYETQFTADAARQLSYFGIIGLLKVTCEELSFASLQIKKSQYNDKTIMLQTKLVSCLTSYLIFCEKSKANKNGKMDDEDLDDVYGDEEDYYGELSDDEDGQDPEQ